MSADLPESLIAYFAERETQRADRAAAFLDGLTEYERHLVHDAAVMGYVQGLMRDQSEGVPKDSQIMALVVDACFAHPDKYPAVHAAFEERRTEVEYFVESRQPDGHWEQASSSDPRIGFIVQRRSALEGRFPEGEFRIARRTTSVTVEAQRTADDD